MTNQEKAQIVAERITGTCMESPESICEELGFNLDEIASDLDGLFFQCEGCGWYCSVDEANENPSGDGDLCDDCHTDDDED